MPFYLRNYIVEVKSIAINQAPKIVYIRKDFFSKSNFFKKGKIAKLQTKK